MHGRFCHMCGQDLFAGRKSGSGQIVYNFLDSIYAVDTKLFDTLKLLLFYPGKLTLEYYQGRIIRYVHPSKLFWFISIVFFLFFSFRLDNAKENKKDTGFVSVKNKSINFNLEGAESDYHDEDSGQKNTSSYPAIVLNDSVNGKESTALAQPADSVKTSHKSEGQGKQHRDNKKFNIDQFFSTFLAYAPYVTLVLIPFFSFLMFIFFRKYMRKYSYHLMFSLHFHAFIYLFIGITVFLSDFWPSVLSGYLLLVPFIYILIAVYVFYKPRMIPAIFKLGVIAVVYFFVMIIAVAFFSILVVYKVSGESWQEFFS